MSLKWLHTLSQIYEDQNKTFETHIPHSKVACQSGCSYCCYHLIFVYLIEALYIRYNIDQLKTSNLVIYQGIKDSVFNAIQILNEFLAQINLQQNDFIFPKVGIQQYQIEKWAQEIYPFYLTWFSLQAPCLFLQNNQCSIYNIRPSACRTYFSQDAEACRSFLALENYNIAIPQPEGREQLKSNLISQILSLCPDIRIPLPLAIANPFAYFEPPPFNDITWNDHIDFSSIKDTYAIPR